MLKTLSPAAVNLVVIAGLAIVAFIDYITGIEIRIYPLYFMPLMLAAWRLPRNITITYAISAAVIWVMVMYGSGREYSEEIFWPINFLTQGSAFLLVSILVNKLQSVIEKERQLSRTDLLTGLHNRRHFFEKSAHVITQCRRNRRPVTLGYIDLDNFKRSNDTLGHEHGDELLQAVADIFRHCLRSEDICARMGGDEFVVLLPETDVEQAESILECIREQLADNKRFSRSVVTASIGAITYRSPPQVVDEMIAGADEMMYRVKGGSKNRVYIEVAKAA